MEENARESVSTPIPGPRSRALTEQLRRHESRNVTAFFDDFPVVWKGAAGAIVADVDGNRYIDLTAAFGVANAGHANPRVAAAVAHQAKRLMHGMGDVHPNDVRADLLERLIALFPPKHHWKAFLATTGSEAVEAALKTAMLATKRTRFAAFRGAYHGLSLGTLPLCGIATFRAPFTDALGPSAVWLDFPDAASDVAASDAIAGARAVLDASGPIAAVVVEPIQGRAGCIVPPHGFLTALGALCHEIGAALILDEIFTGFGRTGSWFAFEREGVLPDIVCIGKAMGSGFPISAAVARSEIMDAWPLSEGEALHTSTYLGNPMGCAAALATFDEIERLGLPQRANELGSIVAARLHEWCSRPSVRAVRGRGLFWGIELRDAALAEAVVRRGLRNGVVLLQSGVRGDTLTIAPPLVIGEGTLARGLDLVEGALDSVE